MTAHWPYTHPLTQKNKHIHSIMNMHSQSVSHIPPIRVSDLLPNPHPPTQSAYHPPPFLSSPLHSDHITHHHRFWARDNTVNFRNCRRRFCTRLRVVLRCPS